MSAEVIYLSSKRPVQTQKVMLLECLLADRKLWIKRLRKTEPYLFNDIDQLQLRLEQLGHYAPVTALDLEIPQ